MIRTLHKQGIVLMSSVFLLTSNIASANFYHNPIANHNNDTKAVSAIVPQPKVGDYRSVGNLLNFVDFASAGDWEVYNGTSWVKASVAPNVKAPENIFLSDGKNFWMASGNYNNIYVTKDVTFYGSIRSGGFNVNPGKVFHVANGSFYIGISCLDINFGSASKLIVGDSATFNVSDTKVKFSSTSFFEVENNATVNVSSFESALWNGVEKFHESSKFNFTTLNGNPLTLLGNVTDFNYNGVNAKFGNLKIDVTSNADVFQNNNFQITHQDLEIMNGFGATTNLNYGSMIVGRDLILGGSGNFLANKLKSNQTLKVNGDFYKNGNGKLTMLNANGQATSSLEIKGDFNLNGGSIGFIDSNSGNSVKVSVSIGGNFTKAASTYLIKGAGNAINQDFNFVGNTLKQVQYVDVTSSTVNNDMQNINFNVKSGAQVSLAKNLLLGTGSTFKIEKDAELDFGFIGSTPNILSRINGQNQQVFSLAADGRLIITSPAGITSGGNYEGNVQIGDTTTRTYSPEAIYQYSGRANQVSGSGLPLAASGKKVIVEMANEALTFQAQGVVNFNANGYLDIRKGVAFDNATGSFAGAGKLFMEGGRYILTQGGVNPKLTGLYSLISGVVEFKNQSTVDQLVNSPKTYNKIEITGKNVKNNTGDITLQNLGGFSVKNGASFDMLDKSIIGTGGDQIFTLEDNAIFRTTNSDGFLGSGNAAVHNSIVNIVLSNGSTVEYSRNGPQKVSVVNTSLPLTRKGYYNLVLAGTGEKTADTGELYVRNVLNLDADQLTIKESENHEIPNVLYANKGLKHLNKKVLFGNNSMLMQDVDAVNEGFINVQRRAVVPTEQYNFWSAPVANQELYKLYGPNQVIQDRTVMQYDTKTDRFVPIASNSLSINAKAYSVKGRSSNDVMAQFVGQANNAGVAVELSVEGNRFNLVGNPYPSNIDLNKMYADNMTNASGINNITQTIRFWDNTNNTSFAQQGSNYNGNSYAVYNLASGIGVPATNAISTESPKIPDGIVKPGQGFMVKANSSGDRKLYFNNSQRTTAVKEDTPYYKGAEMSKDRYWLALDTPGDLTNTIAIAYNDKATNNNDIYDSALANTAASDLLYSLSDDQAKLAIQSRKADGLDEDIVTIGAKYFGTGLHTFRIVKKEGAFADNKSIFIYDKLLNTYTDLSLGNYQFNVQAANNDNRFEIVYRTQAVLGTTALNKDAFVVYKDAQDFVIKSSNALGDVEVYDALGRLVYKTTTTDQLLKISSTLFGKGIYVVKTTNADAIQTKKFIN